MSKSYNNFIWIFDDEKIMKKKVMSIVTWSESLEDKKDPSKCNIFSLIKLFANQIKQDEIAEKYKAWWYWYWHAKLELLELILDYFKEARIKYNQFDNNMSQINKSLEKWNKIANDLADNTYKQMIDLVGLG
jgi:tryptophanyl-tRNA synthetase